VSLIAVIFFVKKARGLELKTLWQNKAMPILLRLPPGKNFFVHSSRRTEFKAAERRVSKFGAVNRMHVDLACGRVCDISII